MLVKENLDSPRSLWTLTVVAPALALWCRLCTDIAGEWVAASVVFAGLVLVLRCYYFLKPTRRQLRLNCRLWTTGIVFFSATIALSNGGARVKTLDVNGGLVLGTATAVAFYVATIVIDILGSLFLSKIRSFVEHGQCQTCGYDIRSTFDSHCPECGARFTMLRKESWLTQSREQQEDHRAVPEPAQNVDPPPIRSVDRADGKDGEP